MAMFEEVAGLLSSGDNLSSLARSIGGDETGTKTALSAGVPVLFGALARRAGTAGGATSLIETLGDTDGSVVDNVSSLFAAEDRGGVGSTLSSAILGSQAETVEATMASSSGLSRSAVTRLLGIAAPTVMSLLARRKASGNLDRTSLASLLDGERSEMDRQGFGPWLALLDSDTVVDDDTGFQAGLAKVAGLGGLGALGAGAAAATVMGKTPGAPTISMPAATSGVSTPTASATAATSGVSAPTASATAASSSGMEVRLPETQQATFTSTSTTSASTTPPATGSVAQPTINQPAAPTKPLTQPAPKRTYETPKTTTREPYRAPEPEKGSRLGWLKWLLPLLLLGILGFILWGCLNSGDDDTASTGDAETATAVATAVPTEAPTEAPTPVPTEPPVDEAAAPVEVEEEPVGDDGYTEGRVPAVAEQQGIFNTLLDSLDSTGLTPTLGGEGEFTIFAPSDAAFSALSPELIGALVENPDILSQVLQYHVVPGYLTADQLATGPIASALGSDLSVNVDGFNPRVNGAFILNADITADNGVIHGIDRVLIPQSVLSFAGVTVNDALSLDAINFEVGSSELTAESTVVLDAAVDYLRNSRTAVEIGGHTDDDGDEASNQELSEARAEAVRAYLIDGGVAAEQLTAVGYGESQPIQDNGTSEGRAANRRIEMNVTGR